MIEYKIGDDIGWVHSACEIWQADWNTMPPGCKDIDLDMVITDKNRKEIFRERVSSIQQLVEEESIRNELGRVLELTA